MRNKLIKLYSIDSTNSYILRENLEEWQIVYALEQTKGRGRLGRVWNSYKNNIMMSINLPLISLEKIYGLQILIGYSVCNVLSKFVNIKLKWPNDLFIDGKKTGGILVETKFAGENIKKVVAGIGINVSSCPNNLDNEVTYLNKYSSDLYYEELIEPIAQEVFNMYSEYNKGLDISLLWPAYSAFIGSCSKTLKEGAVTEKGITPEGHLIIIKDSKEKIITSGDIYGISS